MYIYSIKIYTIIAQKRERLMELKCAKVCIAWELIKVFGFNKSRMNIKIPRVTTKVIENE